MMRRQQQFGRQRAAVSGDEFLLLRRFDVARQQGPVMTLDRVKNCEHPEVEYMFTEPQDCRYDTTTEAGRAAHFCAIPDEDGLPKTTPT